VSDQAAAWLCILMGCAAGGYTVYGWRKGRINFKGVSARNTDPVGFWTAIVCSSLWSAITAGAGVYMILR
jgi:hypothetical protein